MEIQKHKGFSNAATWLTHLWITQSELIRESTHNAAKTFLKTSKRNEDLDQESMAIRDLSIWIENLIGSTVNTGLFGAPEWKIDHVDFVELAGFYISQTQQEEY